MWLALTGMRNLAILVPAARDFAVSSLLSLLKKLFMLLLFWVRKAVKIPLAMTVLSSFIFDGLFKIPIRV